jgi:hypothetical protein
VIPALQFELIGHDDTGFAPCAIVKPIVRKLKTGGFYHADTRLTEIDGPDFDDRCLGGFIFLVSPKLIKQSLDNPVILALDAEYLAALKEAGLAVSTAKISLDSAFSPATGSYLALLDEDRAEELCRNFTDYLLRHCRALLLKAISGGKEELTSLTMANVNARYGAFDERQIMESYCLWGAEELIGGKKLGVLFEIVKKTFPEAEMEEYERSCRSLLAG